MVAIDKDSLKSVPVVPLNLDTNESRKIFSMGAEHKTRKQLSSQYSLQNQPPTVEEMYAIHKIYLDSLNLNGSAPSNSVWMCDTERQSILFTHPQDRNMYNKIFGGYLMRVACELSYVTALLSCKSNVKFVALDDISFKEPVKIGSILSFKSRLVYSCKNYIQVQVLTEVLDHKSGTSFQSNAFYFNFEATEAPRVIPKSYEESVTYIEAQRRFTQNLDL